MPEPLGNVEIASVIHEAKEHRKNRPDREVIVEILDAVLLAIIAVATAWSGYQAARWDGHSAFELAQGLAIEIEARELASLGEIDLVHNVTTLNTWLVAKSDGKDDLAKLLESQFTDDYREAFRAWWATGASAQQRVPPRPADMPGYTNARKLKGDELHDKGIERLEAGRLSREIGEDYTRLTVILALALFLTAISQRFHVRAAKVGLLTFAALIVLITIGLLISYPLG